MKYKVGDKVIVKKGLPANDVVGGIYCNFSMAALGGSVLTISKDRQNY